MKGVVLEVICEWVLGGSMIVSDCFWAKRCHYGSFDLVTLGEPPEMHKQQTPVDGRVNLSLSENTLLNLSKTAFKQSSLSGPACCIFDY
ncbi:hypothetical protein NPIL_378001 [Nephila pilipes]|uniref:Uncharacterized protein n=2 Tax=Nephila pilipes TaxID=299642 RepID=A0A8X6P8Q4_NEPPI|nr:hypothetical protein NPIL_378001 [Nephila pilipes]